MKRWINIFKLMVFPVVFSGLIGLLFAGFIISRVKDDINSFVSLVSQEELQPLETELLINNQTINTPISHDFLGKIKIDSINFQEELLYGTGQEELVDNIGFYSNSKLPGLGSNIVVMGLRNKFLNLSNIQIGDEIKVQMVYGDYVYTVSDIHIVEKNNREHFQKTSEEQLMLVTDYPFDEWGTPTQSFVVIAKLKMVK